MNILGREKEVAFLEDVAESKHKIVFLYGRKGLGKTAIINEFIKGRKALYFSATKETWYLSQQRLMKRLNEFAGEDVSPKKFDLKEIANIIVGLFRSEKKVVVIDNLHFLTQAYPGMFSELVECWERIFCQNDVMLILCGDYTAVCKGGKTEIQDNRSFCLPEYVSTLKVRHLHFNQLHECFPGYSFTELMQRHFVAGGVPEYFKYFYNDEPLLENISKYVLEQGAPLYNAPLTMLEREVREPTYYFSILKTLSKTQQKLHDIYGSLEEKANTLSPYIRALIEMDLIVKRFPPFEKNPEKSRRGNYYIVSTFICFWFCFIYPYLDEIEMGKKDRALNNISLSLFSGDYMWNMSYRIARDIFKSLCFNGALRFVPGERGKTGASRIGNKVALPLVSMEEGTNRTFCAFCQYNYGKPVSIELLDDLMAVCDQAEDTRGKEIIYGLFSKTGFDKDLIDRAKKQGDVLLVNEFDIVVKPHSMD